MHLYLRSYCDRFAISKVTLCCGCKDQPYFSRIFKQVVGSTPTQYKQKILE